MAEHNRPLSEVVGLVLLTVVEPIVFFAYGLLGFVAATTFGVPALLVYIVFGAGLLLWFIHGRRSVGEIAHPEG